MKVISYHGVENDHEGALGFKKDWTHNAQHSTNRGRYPANTGSTLPLPNLSNDKEIGNLNKQVRLNNKIKKVEEQRYESPVSIPIPTFFNLQPGKTIYKLVTRGYNLQEQLCLVISEASKFHIERRTIQHHRYHHHHHRPPIETFL